MSIQVCMGAMMQCSFGVAPSSLVVLPTSQVMAGGPPAATIMDNAPIVNIPPFGMCNSPSNPTVAVATAAAAGGAASALGGVRPRDDGSRRLTEPAACAPC